VTIRIGPAQIGSGAETADNSTAYVGTGFEKTLGFRIPGVLELMQMVLVMNIMGWRLESIPFGNLGVRK
jgi:hypothetical protein